MKNLRIGSRLGLGFGVVLLLLVVLTTISVWRMQNASALTDRLVNVSISNQHLVAEWQKIIELNSVRSEAVWKFDDAAAQQSFKDEIAASTVRAAELQKLVGAGLLKPASKAQFAAVLAVRDSYVTVRKQVFAAKEAGNLTLGKQLFDNSMHPKAQAYLAELGKLADIQQTNLAQTAAGIQASYESARAQLITLGTLAVLFGIGFAVWITRSITGPIRDALHVAETVSNGDLTSAIVVDSSDETGQLMQALKVMNGNLVNIVGQVRTGTETMTTASGEIAAGNQDLSQRTEEQASSLEETASSMEELTSTVKQNADSARQANQMAIDASSIATRGGVLVAEVVTTMSSINASSRKIVDIISVIDSIAFQTNILALNAAVEAARAGEQGRGFAVVATEVRSLAHRSAAAAKEIKVLIDDSVSKVELGSNLVDRAGQTMDEIVKSTGHVTDIMNEITAASEEQRAGIEQVNQAITQMDSVTQQNAALVEQAAAAAEAMQEQALRLSDVVSVFKLAGPATLARPVRAPLARTAPARTALAASPPARAARREPVTSGGDDWESF